MRERTINFQEALDVTQYKAVTSDARFIRVIAGAGSGKTRVLTYRYAYLMQEKHVIPNNILCVTFTNRATDEMVNRIVDLIGIVPPSIMTLNSLGNKILSREIKRIGWLERPQIYSDEAAQIPVIKRILDTYRFSDNEISIRDVMNLITIRKKKLDYLKYLTVDAETDLEDCIENSIVKKNLFEYMYYMYLKNQLENKFIDFTDQVCMPLMLFDMFPDMRETWSHRYHHIMVDEFQDMSDANYKLCEVLTGESNHLFVVGDPDQMIYGWRDASPDYLNNFEKEHKETDCFELMSNYRSTKEIVSASNRLICNNDSHDKKLEMVPIQQEDEAPKIQYYHCELEIDSLNEEKAIARNIKQLLDEGIEGKNIAVLYRNHICADGLKHMLKEKGIDYQEYRDDNLNAIPIVKKTIALMKMIVSQNDATFNLLIDCFKDTIDFHFLFEGKSTSSKEETCYLQFLKLLKEKPDQYPSAERIINVIQEATDFLQVKESTVYDVVRFILTESGILDEVKKYRIKEEEESIEEFLNRISTMQKESENRITMEECLAYLEADDKEKDDKSVILSTIHAAKGLEFDYIFVIHMNYAIMPSKSSLTLQALEEERRLAYVAFTRAKKQLWISETSSLDYEEKPSPFIFEAGEGVAELEQIGTAVSEQLIQSVQKRFKKRVLAIRFMEMAYIENSFSLVKEVEHPIYGHGTFQSFALDGSIMVKFDTIASYLKIYDVEKLQIISNEEELHKSQLDELLKKIMELQDSDNALLQQVRSVLNQIDMAAQDKEHHDKVSVLGLPCGTGKSSAISLKMCRVIAAYEAGAKEGILILSNNNEQLKRYLTSNIDPDVNQFLRLHKNKIIVMNKNNKKWALKQTKHCPVLIITTQRYFRLDYFDLIKNFIHFGNSGDCTRKLIIIDEEPNVYENYMISATELNLIDSAIKKGLTDLENQEEKEFCIQQWDMHRAYYEKLLRECECRAIEAGRKVSYEYVSDFNRRHALIVSEVEKGKASSMQRAESWTAVENMEKFFTILKKHRFEIMFAMKDEKKDEKDGDQDIWGMIIAIFSMAEFGALYEFRSELTGQYRSQFSILVDNYIYFDPSLDTKIVILDGTADLSPTYWGEKFYVLDNMFQRRLENLTIKLYDLATGKTRMIADQVYRDRVLSFVEESVIPDIQPDEEWAVFTNQDLEDFFKEKFHAAIIEHFGNIRGKNSFNSMHHIAQVGMYRYPPSIYFLFEANNDPELLAELCNLSEKGEDTYRIIQDRISDKKGKTKEIMDRFLLCDIEQNLFRGIIRSSSEEPYTYYLFISAYEYRNLISNLVRRYRSAGATVNLPEMKLSKHDKFMEWYNGIDVDTQYTNENILDIIHLPIGCKLKDWYKDYPDIKAILAKDRVEGRRGVYEKKA